MVKIALGKYKAVIFDMDGTMVDTIPWHKKSYEILFNRLKIPFSDEYYKKHIVGRKNSEIFPIIFTNKTQEQIDKLIYEKEAIFREIYKNNIYEVKGLTNLIKQINTKGLMLAVATTAPKENREFFFNSLKLHKELFSVIVGDEEVVRGKPHPEIYLKTGKKLNTKPDQCLVFEDSASGVKAAKSAGMTVVAIATNKMPETLQEADYVVNDFSEIELVEK